MKNSGGNIVLDEHMDENYEPTTKEIEEYAEWLGMDLEVDRDLFWIAREGLKAPLPKPWKPCQSEDGEIFYFNFETGESVWDHPCDEHYRKMYQDKKRDKDEEVLRKKEKKKDKKDKRDSIKDPLDVKVEGLPKPGESLYGVRSKTGNKLVFDCKPKAGAKASPMGASPMGASPMGASGSVTTPKASTRRESSVSDSEREKATSEKERELKEKLQQLQKEFEDKKKKQIEEQDSELVALEQSHQVQKRERRRQLEKELEMDLKRSVEQDLREKLKPWAQSFEETLMKQRSSDIENEVEAKLDRIKMTKERQFEDDVAKLEAGHKERLEERKRNLEATLATELTNLTHKLQAQNEERVKQEEERMSTELRLKLEAEQEALQEELATEHARALAKIREGHQEKMRSSGAHTGGSQDIAEAAAASGSSEVVHQLKQEVEDLKKQLGDQKSQVSHLKTSAEESGGTEARLRKDKEELESKVAAQQSELETLRQAAGTEAKQLQVLISTAADNARKMCEAEITKLKDQLAARIADNQALQAQLETAKQEQQKRSQHLAPTAVEDGSTSLPSASDGEDREEQSAKAQRRIAELERALVSKDGQLDQLEADLAKAKQAAQAQKAQVVEEGAADRVEELESKLLEKGRKIQELQGTVEDWRSRASSGQAEVTRLKEEVSLLTTKVGNTQSTAEEQLQALRAARDAQEAELASLQASVSAATSEAAKWQSMMQTSEAELERFRSETHVEQGRRASEWQAQREAWQQREQALTAQSEALQHASGPMAKAEEMLMSESALARSAQNRCEQLQVDLQHAQAREQALQQALSTEKQQTRLMEDRAGSSDPGTGVSAEVSRMAAEWEAEREAWRQREQKLMAQFEQLQRAAGPQDKLATEQLLASETARALSAQHECERLQADVQRLQAREQALERQLLAERQDSSLVADRERAGVSERKLNLEAAEVARLQQELGVMSSQARSAQQAYEDKLAATRTELHEQASSHTSQLSVLRMEKSAASNEAASWQRCAETREADLQRLRSDIHAERGRQAAEWQSEREAWQGRERALQAQCDAFQRSGVARLEKPEDHHPGAAAAAAELERMKEMLASEKGFVVQLQSQTDQLRSDCHRLRGREEALERQLRDEQQECLHTSEKIGASTRNVMRLEVAEAALESSARLLTSELRAASSEAVEARQSEQFEARRGREEVRILQSRLSQAEDDARMQEERCRRMSASTESTLKESDEKLTVLRNELQRTDKELQEASSKLRAEARRRDEVSGEFEEELRSLKRQLAQKEVQIADVQAAHMAKAKQDEASLAAERRDATEREASAVQRQRLLEEKEQLLRAAERVLRKRELEVEAEADRVVHEARRVAGLQLLGGVATSHGLPMAVATAPASPGGVRSPDLSETQRLADFGAARSVAVLAGRSAGLGDSQVTRRPSDATSHALGAEVSVTPGAGTPRELQPAEREPQQGSGALSEQASPLQRSPPRPAASVPLPCGWNTVPDVSSAADVNLLADAAFGLEADPGDYEDHVALGDLLMAVRGRAKHLRRAQAQLQATLDSWPHHHDRQVPVKSRPRSARSSKEAMHADLWGAGMDLADLLGVPSQRHYRRSGSQTSRSASATQAHVRRRGIGTTPRSTGDVLAGHAAWLQNFQRSMV